MPAEISASPHRPAFWAFRLEHGFPHPLMAGFTFLIHLCTLVLINIKGYNQGQPYDVQGWVQNENGGGSLVQNTSKTFPPLFYSLSEPACSRRHQTSTRWVLNLPGIRSSALWFCKGGTYTWLDHLPQSSLWQWAWYQGYRSALRHLREQGAGDTSEGDEEAVRGGAAGGTGLQAPGPAPLSHWISFTKHRDKENNLLRILRWWRQSINPKREAPFRAWGVLQLYMLYTRKAVLHSELLVSVMVTLVGIHLGSW